MATGILRWRGRLDYAIGQAASKPVRQLHPLVLDLLRLTAYQLLFLDRIPPSAAVNESVKLAKARRLPPALTAFVNAVSRTLAAGINDLPLPDPETAAGRQPWPPPPPCPSGWRPAGWQNLGRDAAWARAQANNLHPPLTIRVNTSLDQSGNLENRLTGRRGRHRTLPLFPPGTDHPHPGPAAL